MKRTFIAILLFLLFNSVLLGQLEVSLDAPTESEGAYFDITAEIEPNMSTYHEFYLDVSFPNGVQSVEIRDKNDWVEAEIYEKGDDIHHRWGYMMEAKYPLVSAFINESDGHQNLKLEIRVYPNVSGNVDIYYRGTRYYNEPVEIVPANSFKTDQQGWPVYRKTVYNKPERLPDLVIDKIEVNDDDKVYAGEEVDIEAYVEERNDKDAGRVKVDFEINNRYIDYDYTGEVDAGERKKAKIEYTFPNGGEYRISANADPDDDIPEKNESNNYDDITIRVYTNNPPHVNIDNIDIDGDKAEISWRGTDEDDHDIKFRYKIDNQSWSGWGTATSKEYTLTNGQQLSTSNVGTNSVWSVIAILRHLV